jgi:hypothetical protein
MSEEIVTAPVPQETPEEPSAAVSEPPALEQASTPPETSNLHIYMHYAYNGKKQP